MKFLLNLKRIFKIKALYWFIIYTTIIIIGSKIKSIILDHINYDSVNKMLPIGPLSISSHFIISNMVTIIITIISMVINKFIPKKSTIEF